MWITNFNPDVADPIGEMYDKIRKTLGAPIQTLLSNMQITLSRA